MDLYNRGDAYSQNEGLFIEFCDNYEHISDDIEYVVENVLQTTNTDTASYHLLREKFNTFYDLCCTCTKLTTNDNECNNCDENSDCIHGGNYKSTDNESNENIELVLNQNRKCSDLIYECSDRCACSNDCRNRLVQYGPRRHLLIFDFSHVKKQFGLITTKSIPIGGFICEYAGELLTKNEAIKRQHLNDINNQMNYIICLNEQPIQNATDKNKSNRIETFIDPSLKGNIGRYLNHSCDPNCEILSIRLDGPIPKLGTNVYSFN